VCFEHQPNTTGRNEERTFNVTRKRQRRRQLLRNSGKHVAAIVRQQTLHYCVHVEKSNFVVYFPYLENKYWLRTFCSSICVYPLIVARQRLGKQVPAAKNIYATIKAILDASFSIRCVSYERKKRLVLSRTSCCLGIQCNSEKKESHAPAALSLGKSPRYSFNRGLGGSQSLSGRCGGEKNRSLPGIEPRSSIA
jgi:hypothetical protein